MESGITAEKEKDLEFLYIIINKALKNEHTKYNLLRSQTELRNAKFVKFAHQTVLRKLKTLANNVFLVYLAGINKKDLNPLIKTNLADLLLEYKKIEFSIEFYQEELKNVKHIIKEFRTYRFYHKYRVWILNEYRPEEDLQDWTTVPFSFW